MPDTQLSAMNKLAKAIVGKRSKPRYAPSGSNAAPKSRVKKARRRIKAGKRRINAPSEDYFNPRMNKRLVRHGYRYKGKRNAWIKKPRYTPQEDAIDAINPIRAARRRRSR